MKCEWHTTHDPFGIISIHRFLLVNCAWYLNIFYCFNFPLLLPFLIFPWYALFRSSPISCSLFFLDCSLYEQAEFHHPHYSKPFLANGMIANGIRNYSCSPCVKSDEPMTIVMHLFSWFETSYVWYAGIEWNETNHMYVHIDHILFAWVLMIV